MLTGRKIDDRFLDRWKRDLCSELERSTGRPFALVHDDRPAQGAAIEVHRVYETSDDMELDTDRLAGRLVKDFGPRCNDLFPRMIRRWSA